MAALRRGEPRVVRESGRESAPDGSHRRSRRVLRVELSRRLGRFDSALRNMDSLFARPSQPDTLLRQILDYERQLILDADRSPREIPHEDQ
jgi:hypothetical protein